MGFIFFRIIALSVKVICIRHHKSSVYVINSRKPQGTVEECLIITFLINPMEGKKWEKRNKTNETKQVIRW